MTAYANNQEGALTGALEAVERDGVESRASRARLVENIKRASQAGASTRQIARAAGLSHQRVHQIIHDR